MILGLVIWNGFGFDSLKLLLVVLFFWIASPVAGHMISRLEVTTDKDLGEIEVKRLESGQDEMPLTENGKTEERS